MKLEPDADFSDQLVIDARLEQLQDRFKAAAGIGQANLAGQKTDLSQQLKGVTVLGPVKNPNVPWVAGLTLAQAIATADYIGSVDPKEIIITRQGETATVDAKSLLNGKVIPLESGDVIELR